MDSSPSAKGLRIENAWFLDEQENFCARPKWPESEIAIVAFSIIKLKIFKKPPAWIHPTKF